jgi:putative membrane protein
LKRYHNATVALLTGFILGSLPTLWPWKESIVEIFGTKEVTIGFVWNMPTMSAEFIIAALWCVLGIITIYGIEWLAKKVVKN